MSYTHIFATVVLAVGSTVAIAAEEPQEPAPAALSVASPVDAVPSPSEERRLQEASRFFEREATMKGIYGGFARLWLGRDLEEGNALVRAAYDRLLVEAAEQQKVENASTMTPALAGAERVKWQMCTWVRLHYLFSDQSKAFPGRLSKENQELIKGLFWNWLQNERNCGHGERERPERWELRFVSAIHGSENHEIMRISNILMAAQILKDDLEYRGKTLPDGVSLSQRYEQWCRFYKLRWDEMAKHGLLAEAFSAYGKYTLPEIVNMADFCEEPVLRKKSEMLLDLIWAEWAIGQLNGVRGGGKNRIYQGDENKRAQGDTWRLMSTLLFDNGPWHTHWHPDPIRGCPRVMASSNYRVPQLIQEIARDPVGRGEYTYVGKRLARQKTIPASEVPVWWSPWYHYDPVDTRMLAYDYCTPDYVMGCLFIDPTLPLAGSHDYLKGRGLQEGYTALSSQNIYTSIVFPTDLNARVVPQCLPSSKTYLKTSLQYQSVQHENVMVIQRNQKSRNAKAMRIFFSTGMKERLEERGGWQLLQEGDAFLAVKAFSRTNGKDACAHAWKDDCWLHPEDGDAPVVFVLGRKAKYADMGAFADYVMSTSTTLEAQRFTIKIRDAHETPVELSLFLDGSAIPLVNGKSIDFRPENVFDSPFLHSKAGSGVVTIQKGDRSLILDFNTTTVTQVEAENEQ